jgi:hypothetical protein
LGALLLINPQPTEEILLPVHITIDEHVSNKSKELGLDEKLVFEVIRCEGTLYPNKTNENKNKNGIVWSRDWGPLQINDYYHSATMKKRNMDIHNQYDSVTYGLEMMKKEGTKPWKASKHCWNK